MVIRVSLIRTGSMRATSELRFLFSNPNGVKHRRSDVDSKGQQASKVKEVRMAPDRLRSAAAFICCDYSNSLI